MKLYCYVDETGQNTQGRVFIVSVVVIGGEERQDALQMCSHIERSSGKGAVKWARAKPEARLSYMREVL